MPWTLGPLPRNDKRCEGFYVGLTFLAGTSSDHIMEMEEEKGKSFQVLSTWTFGRNKMVKLFFCVHLRFKN